jgi:hypothetical protein
MNAEQVIGQTRLWIERLVIGYQLCPFAKVPFDKDRIRYQVSFAPEREILLERLVEELVLLHRADPQDVETSFLIVPELLQDFRDYLDVLELGEIALKELGLEGIIQIASFHPEYRFAGSEPYDPANYTNRSPFPMFHLIREDSIERAIKYFPRPEEIPDRNVRVMRELGLEKVKQILDEIKRAD